VGVDVVAGPATIGLSKAFDAADTLSIGVGVNHSINDRVSIVGSFNKTVAGDNDSMVIAAGLQVTF
jgi:hypothetical protein